MQTADAGIRGNSGDILLRTGKAKQGNSGSVLFETGPASSGEGGKWNLGLGLVYQHLLKSFSLSLDSI